MVVRFLATLAEWVVYDALGGLCCAADGLDDGGVDPLA